MALNLHLKFRDNKSLVSATPDVIKAKGNFFYRGFKGGAFVSSASISLFGGSPGSFNH